MSQACPRRPAKEECWKQMDQNLRKLKEAGKAETGETLPYHGNGERQSREEIVAEDKRRKAWLKKVRKQVGWK